MFKKLLLCAVLCASTLTAFASQSTIDTSGLSDAQIAEIKAIAAQKSAEVARQKDEGGVALPKDPGAMATLAATWGQQAAAAAEGFAKALSIAAKELGITINEFLATPAGKLTAILIVWKVAGASIVHLLYSMLFVTVGLSIARVIYVKLFTQEYKEVQYSHLFGLISGTKLVRIPKSIHDLETDGEWFSFNLMIAISVLTIIIAGIII